MSLIQVRCPRCRASVSWQENPYRPFCSERCRMVDLGAWAAEEYRLPGPELESEVDPDQRQPGDGE